MWPVAASPKINMGKPHGENEALNRIWDIVGYSQFSETNIGPQADRRASTVARREAVWGCAIFS
jgi:hypothetical protein